ncbi:MAG: cytochrome c oxidase subunit 2A [Paenibacillaceae bacterium]
MAKLQRIAKEMKKLEHQDSRLKGTFISVMILGGFILGCWIFVFILFVVRNGG